MRLTKADFLLAQALQQYFDLNDGPQITLEVGTHDPNRDTTKFRVSDAGRCHLYRYWKRQGQPGEVFAPDVKQRLTLDAGNLFHAYLTHALDALNLLSGAEIELTDEHRIGHLDALVAVDRKILLYDFKTVNGKKMYYLTQRDEPEKPHVYQLLTYAEMYQAQLSLSIDALRIAYLNRDTMEIAEYEVDRQRLAEVAFDWEILTGAWERQHEPTPTPERWECQYCQYNQTCQYATNRG